MLVFARTMTPNCSSRRGYANRTIITAAQVKLPDRLRRWGVQVLVYSNILWPPTLWESDSRAAKFYGLQFVKRAGSSEFIMKEKMVISLKKELHLSRKGYFKDREDLTIRHFVHLLDSSLAPSPPPPVPRRETNTVLKLLLHSSCRRSSPRECHEYQVFVL